MTLPQNEVYSTDENINSLSTSGIPKTFSPDEKSDEAIRNEKIMEGLGNWVGYWRANPHRFVKEYLKIFPFSWFQEIILFMMFKSNHFLFWASRGLGKTHLCTIYCLVRCVLYPNTTVVVVSCIKKQAMEIISTKLVELQAKHPAVAREILKLQTSEQDGRAIFKNGSKLIVVPATENARGYRATCILVDEFRMVDEKVITNVLKKTLTSSRRPAFVDKVMPDGSTPYINYKEPNMEIYISSAYYKNHWSWDKYLAFKELMLKGDNYFTCALPYQLGIKEGILLKETVMDEMKESNFDEVMFQMEMETIPFGENEKAFFKLGALQKVRGAQIPLVPINIHDYFDSKDTGKPIKRDFYRRHSHNQVRILSMDIAMMGSSSTKNNDATVFIETTCTPEGTEYRKTVEYIETLEGDLTQKQALRAKQLYYDLECDYFVIDTAGSGIGVYDSLMEKTYDSERNIEYPAWTLMPQFAEEKMDRSPDPDAIPVVFSVKANAETNHERAVYTRSQIQSGKLKLLLSESDASDFLMKMPEYKRLDAMQQLDVRAPYIQTSLLINEMINLEAEIRGGLIRLKEPSQRSRKDRYSSLSYGLYLAKQLEQDLKVQDEQVDMMALMRQYAFFG